MGAILRLTPVSTSPNAIRFLGDRSASTPVMSSKGNHEEIEETSEAGGAGVQYGSNGLDSQRRWNLSEVRAVRSDMWTPIR